MINSEKNIRVFITLDKKLNEELNIIAKKNDTTKSEIITKALKRLLKNERKEEN